MQSLHFGPALTRLRQRPHDPAGPTELVTQIGDGRPPALASEENK
jgi:hypothetical protein